MELEYSKRAIKSINGMDRISRQRIKKAIELLPDGDVKTMKGLSGGYRLRVGDWRIVFSYLDENTILIEKVAPRGEVYKGV